MNKKALKKRSGSKRSAKSFFYFRLAVAAMVVGMFVVFGLIGKNSLAQSWSEPTGAPPSNNVSAPIWNQTSSAQTGSFYVSGKGRFDTTGTGDTYCTNGKVCGVDAASSGGSNGVVGESNTGYGMYASSVSNYGLYASSGSSYAGYFQGNVYVNGTINAVTALQVNGTNVCLSNGANCQASGGYWTASGNNIYNNNTGSVGIGTNSPNYKLDVRGTIMSGNDLVGGAGTLRLGNGGAGAFTIVGNDATGNVVINNANTAGGSIDLQSRGASALFIQSGGNRNVGVGTAAPGAQLDIVGPANGNGANLRTLGDIMVGTATGASIFFDGNYSYAGGSYIKAAAANTQAFFTSGTERVRIDPSGNVGIGTSTPNNKLQVARLIDFDANSNTFLGDSAGNMATTSFSNVGIGVNALASVSSGGQNTAIGYETLMESTASYNTAVGYDTLWGTNTGGNNVAVGANAGTNWVVPYLSTVNNSTFVGYGTGSSIDGITNSMALGNGAQVTASNQVVIGNTSVTATKINGALNTTGAITQNGTAVCLSNGTNCLPSGGGDMLPEIRFSRAKVAPSSTLATRDAQCVTDFGSNYYAASLNDISIRPVSGQICGYTSDAEYITPNAIQYVCGAGDAVIKNSWNVSPSSPSSLPVVCVKKTSEVLFTRGKIAVSSTLATRDAKCVTDFGSNYQTASSGDLVAIPINGPNTDLILTSDADYITPNATYGFSGSTTGQYADPYHPYMWSSGTNSGSDRVACIKKS